MDLISRQAAIEHLKKRLYETALNNVTEHPYYEEMADNRVSVWLKEVPSAQPVDKDINVPCTDTISRRAAIDALDALCDRECEYSKQQRNFMCGACRLGSAFDVIDDLPSAQPEIKPIEYRDCANAMLRMWMDNVVTDGEYNRVMDKLNAHWGMNNE